MRNFSVAKLLGVAIFLKLRGCFCCSNWALAIDDAAIRTGEVVIRTSTSHRPWGIVYEGRPIAG